MIAQLTNAQYHGAGRSGPLHEWHLSKSLLFDFAKSPYVWKWKHDQGIKKEVTASMEWGSLVDCMATSPKEFADRAHIVRESSWRTNAAKAARDSARENGLIPVLADDLAAITCAAAVLEKHFQRNDLDFAQKQVAATSFWTGASGRKYTIKALADFFWSGAGKLADLKTTNDLSVRSLGYTIRDFGYHWQAALYIDAFRANGADIAEEFPLHFQETDAPYRTRVWHLEPEDIAQGRREYLEALQLWDHCVTTDQWPGEEMDEVTGRRATYDD